MAAVVPVELSEDEKASMKAGICIRKDCDTPIPKGWGTRQDRVTCSRACKAAVHRRRKREGRARTQGEADAEAKRIRARERARKAMDEAPSAWDVRRQVERFTYARGEVTEALREAGEPTDLEALATWAEKAANLLDDQIERAKKERSRLRSLAKRTRTKIDADAQPALLAEGKAPADPPWVALLGKLPDAVIAEQHAIPVGRVARRRRKSGIHAPIVSTEPAAEAAEPAAEAAAETAARIELRADVLLTDPMDQHRAQRIALAVFDQAGVKTDERSALFRRLEIDPNDGDRVWSALCAAGDVHRDRSSGWATCTRDVLPAGDEPSRAPEPEPEPAAKAPTWSAGEVWIRGGLAREITRVASDCVWWRPTGRRGDGKPYAERRTTPGAWARWARGARRAETDAERRVYGVGGAL